MSKKLIVPIISFLFSINLFAQEELCPPAGLTVFGGDQENIIAWGEPIGNIGCGDFAIDALPFSHQGNNSGMGDDWPVAGSQGEDVAYTLNVSEATTFDFTLCSENTDYDTKLEIFTNGQDCLTPTSTGNYNDDFTCEVNGLFSSLMGVTLQPGQYYVVVDGYGGAIGNYELSVSVVGRNESNGYVNNSIKTVWPIEITKMEEQGLDQSLIADFTIIVTDPLRYTVQNNSSREIPEECGTFTAYRVYNASNNSILTETTELSYTHGSLINGEEFCYYVTTVYDEGESEATNTECATPSTFDPMPPTNLYAEVWDEEVSIYWTSPDVLVLGIPYEESFDEGGLLDLWLVDGGENWIYDDIGGNPTPCFRFNWSPSVQEYDQSLYAPVLPLGDLTEVSVSFDFEFDNWATSGAEFLSIEYKTGSDADWTVLEALDNSGEDFPFTNFTYEVSGLSENIQVRFHAYGATTYDINSYLIDNFSVTSASRTSRNEYDFLGYNVYLDNVLDNTDIFDTTGYTVYGLDNEVEYTLGVTSVYEGAEGDINYESSPLTVIVQSIYVFGDVTGIISDPNGAALDSVIVSSGGVSDTTDLDGSYTLWNLDVGINPIMARRSGFYSSNEDVEVLAQADPTTQNFVLSPDMPSPVGLNASPLDEEIYLEWRTPGGVALYDLAYYDEVLEGQIGCGGTCQFSVRFTPSNYPAMLTGFVVSLQGGASAVGASIDVYLDPDGLLIGPVGDPINLVPSADLSAPDELVQYEFDVSGVGVEITSGDIYIVVNENSSGFLAIANDNEPQSPEYYDRNWVSTGGEWGTIFDVVAGDPGLTGDFGILAQFMGAPGRSNYALSSSGDRIEEPLVSIGRFSNYNSDESVTETDIVYPDFMTQLNELYIPVNPSPTNVDRDDLIEYRVYSVDENDNETFVVATNDTFATVSASPNYLEYCYNISAYWATDNYGDLESRHSNIACSVPFKLGDSDFDSDVDISDILAVIDFILDIDMPSEDQFRNVDVNMDQSINIADVVMIVDIIFGGTGRTIEFDANETAFIDLFTDYDNSVLNFDIEYNSPIRGIEFILEFNPSLINVLSPTLPLFQENVMLSYTEIEPGKLKVLAANLEGGQIEAIQSTFMTIPVQFTGDERDVANVSIDGINLAGGNGSLIKFVTRTNSSEVKVIPGEFALHQNFPNPFNPSTEIQFDLPEAGNVYLAIYNLMGQKIRTLSSNEMTPGYHAIVWDGTNDMGSQVATGMYFYSIQTSEFHATKKMLFLK
ncbi:MAG: T9SS type A sorting domain-containing protein [Candidatus Marinimicrobia bacterium]|nr:T9SS type A sorting domain-containing protein [Candidatus Neomarinimicrobiota bacterium]MBT4282962.1 T9SS type A sorting domain-containing protein [Candidatus Neomarinimicrobiota bacterium]MBT4579479.1 T9SS type A sorting domain-containing protein [Candidatus Neomarinimicrobiota bacterium]MBT5363828.1 T9SS type A sorting domain-containing protein [Candidatus Neomarinimicrobiota bacterium]MBT7114414.1 T9SS type A sorting domain-containing protein [Candidatus Neomarinimicrobiota bacterium]